MHILPGLMHRFLITKKRLLTSLWGLQILYLCIACQKPLPEEFRGALQRAEAWSLISKQMKFKGVHQADSLLKLALDYQAKDNGALALMAAQKATAQYRLGYSYFLLDKKQEEVLRSQGKLKLNTEQLDNLKDLLQEIESLRTPQ